MHLYAYIWRGMCLCTLAWEGFPRRAGEGLERLLPAPPITVLQRLMRGSYLERKRILHSAFINVKWQGKLLRDSSSSDPHFLLRGHPWDTAGKQGSHFLISCYTQQTRLKCSISCCSLPAATEGKTTHHPQTGTTTAISVLLLWAEHRGGQGGREGWEAWMWTHPYSRAVLPCICAKPHSWFCVFRNDLPLGKNTWLL